MKKKPFKVSKAYIQKWKLDPEEIEILEAFENGEYKPVPLTPEKKTWFQDTARNTLARLKKEKSITLRMNESVLGDLKKIAKHEGMPYQTLIGSILHKYTQKYSLVQDK